MPDHSRPELHQGGFIGGDWSRPSQGDGTRVRKMPETLWPVPRSDGGGSGAHRPDATSLHGVRGDAGRHRMEQKKAIGGSSHRGIPKTSINLATKLEILKKLEEGVSVPSIVAEYNVGRSTVYDVKYAKHKLLKFQLETSEEVTVKRTRMDHSIKYRDIEEATIEWYKQQRAAGFPIRSFDIQGAAKRFASIFNIEDFSASTGWLYRFRRRHGVERMKVSGESLGTHVESVGPFGRSLKDTIPGENLSDFQVWNGDGTGFCQRGLLSATQAGTREAQLPGRDISKGRLSILFCANADGSHRVPVAVVGKSKRPRVVRECVDSLSVTYYASASAWLAAAAFERWFHRDFVPAVVKFQQANGACSGDDVRALLLLDNTSARLVEEPPSSHCGRVKVVILPRSTARRLQPVDQATTETTKRHCKRKCVESCPAIEGQEGRDTRAERTLANFKEFDIKGAVGNPANGCNELPCSYLAKAWKKRLTEDMMKEDIRLSYPHLEADGLAGVLNHGAEGVIAPEDAEEWLHLGGDDHGGQHHADEKSTDQNANPVAQEEEKEETAEVGDVERRVLLLDVRKAFDVICSWMGTFEGGEIVDRDIFARVKQLRCQVIKMQRSKNTQCKVDGLLKRERKPSEPSTTTQPRPSTSAS
ncbi:tigger transposable element-derived protein 7-like isoform X5 [Lethenteron reissneri]|uniref:tigger transposable element-derived protein 7-like isoform X5 n=1 Tax=Lethenteron reissneri TaxID=7753 RepID=UPI002AB6893C|nr:tigger transposable element-derived protein 7-like isoform X5 [Lethenteron reissneri]XP_061427549.1 tigger transposable element-derived protein 7-like isoform X5 [Lethenteron reissneri]XP_061427556.1 tigger transposable element-derived protein 7-like isoform X5 [Lethenteron reissneri]